MFLYWTLGTNDLARARRFYDPVLAQLGIALRTTELTELGYAPPAAPRIQLWITLPFDGAAASHGNGTMVAFAAERRAQVDAFHRVGLAHGGTNDGIPGLRPYGPHFYACYLRDPDGNKLSAVCETAPV